LLAGFLETWDFRFLVLPDGISYLDIANAYFRGDWNAAINAYWSPLYSWLLGLGLYVAKPSPYRESTVVHLINFAIHVGALVCFEFFFVGLLRLSRTRQKPEERWAPLPEGSLWAFGYTLFIWNSVYIAPVDLVTPDLTVAALTFLASGLVLRIGAGESRARNFAFLGAVLGMAYLAKAVMFPLAFVFLGTALFAAGNLRRAVPRVLWALAMFFLVAGPFVAAISSAKGRLTFGDTGKITYAVWVTGVRDWVHWQGDEVGLGTPKHPVRKIFAGPPVYEFAKPIAGTYPVWYDPSYWMDGITPHVNWREYLLMLRDSAETYAGILSYQKALAVGFFVLFLLERRWRKFAYDVASLWSLWLPPAVALVLYELVHLEWRFVGGHVVLLWACLLAALRLPRGQTWRKVIQSVTLAVLIPMGANLAATSTRTLVHALRRPPHGQWEVAAGLQKMGLRPGDKLASIGNTIEAYWAHLAGVSFVAEVKSDDVAALAAASPQIQAQVLETLARTGARAVVTDAAPPFASHQGWQRIGRTRYYAYFFSK